EALSDSIADISLADAGLFYSLIFQNVTYSSSVIILLQTREIISIVFPPYYPFFPLNQGVD
ncbi:hypothetical protein, partial [Enterobacter hormaechei]|uniref:hypothetical protein n=1 Tax=Enterobacter hormaechei TaxID=158836 RepID=UPI001C54AE81